MSVTLLQARTEVRALLDESSPAFWTNSQLNSWINQGCADIAREAQVLWQEVIISVSPLTQTYDFPADFLNCHRAEFSPTGSEQTYSMEFRPINTMDEIWGILHSLPAAWPQYFTIRGNNYGYFLMLYPAPGAAGTMTVYYYRQAVAVNIDSNFIDTLSGWEDIVYDYAVFKALRAAKDATWQQAMSLYQANLAGMIQKSRNMTDLGESITTGIPQWPIYAYGGNEGW